MSTAERRLLISPELMAAAEEQAAAAYPEECCGVMVGDAEGSRGAALVVRLMTAANAHPGDRQAAYRIAPERLLQIHKQARAEGLEVVGYYHSHPGRPAVPSETDRAEAFLGASHLILSVRGGRVLERRSWRLAEEGQFLEEAVEMIAPPAGDGR